MGNTLQFIGDHQPISTMFNGQMISGYDTNAYSGQEISVSDTYNDNLDLTVFGRSEQTRLNGVNLFDVLTMALFKSQLCNATLSGSAVIIQHTKTDDYTGSWYYYAFSLPNLEIGKTYTFSDDCHYADPANANNGYVSAILFHRQDGTRISYISRNYNSPTTFTVPDECVTVGVQYTLNKDWRVPLPVSNTLTVTNVQVQLGSTATPYEPYCGGIPAPNPDYPQEIQLSSGTITASPENGSIHPPTSLTNPALFGMVGVYDTFENRVLVDGVWRSRHTQRWGEKVLNGTELIDVNPVWQPRGVFTIDLTNALSEWTKAYSTHFISREMSISSYDLRDGEFQALLKRIHFCIKKLSGASASDVQNYFATQHAAGTPVIIYYQLAEPIVTLSNPIPLKTYPFQTNISTNAAIKPQLTANIRTIHRT